ncbi:MAG: hypothetical protein Q9202_003072 [Teloschistes flavicans]
MRCNPLIAAFSLLGLCLASSVVHQHAHEQFHNQRRDALLARNKLEASSTANATCGCTTVWTTWYGEPTLIQPAEQNSTTSQTTTTLTQTSTHALPSTQEPPTTSLAPPIIHEEAASPSPKPAAAPPAKEALPKPAPPTQKPSAKASSQPDQNPASNSKTNPIQTTGSQWSMTYSPYTAQGGCKPSSAVAADVALIAQKGFSAIRLYSTDCNGLSAVATPAVTHSLTLILGVYISTAGIPAARPQIQEIIAWATTSPSSSNPNTKENKWHTVQMIVIGNEAIFNHFCTPPALASFLASAKSAFRAAGYTGPVTTTEPLSTLSQHADLLCPVTDVLAANIHPFFNGAVAAADAGAFVAQQLAALEDVCPGGEEGGKEVFNLETGWPSRGEANGVAVPGTWEQGVAVEGIRRAAGGKSAFFSFVDDLWKEEGEWGVERSWGCSHLF